MTENLLVNPLARALITENIRNGDSITVKDMSSPNDDRFICEIFQKNKTERDKKDYIHERRKNMIEYSMYGAWGKTIPEEKLLRELAAFGIELDVKLRRDGLSDIKLKIDDEKILSSQKRMAKKGKTAVTKETSKSVKTSGKKGSSK